MFGHRLISMIGKFSTTPRSTRILSHSTRRGSSPALTAKSQRWIRARSPSASVDGMFHWLPAHLVCLLILSLSICPGLYLVEPSILMMASLLLSVFDITNPRNKYGTILTPDNAEYTGGTIRYVSAPSLRARTRNRIRCAAIPATSHVTSYHDPRRQRP